MVIVYILMVRIVVIIYIMENKYISKIIVKNVLIVRIKDKVYKKYKMKNIVLILALDLINK